MSLAPLSYTTIQAWAALMDTGTLHPLEIEALIMIDSAMFDISDEEDATPKKRLDSKANKITQATGPWPDKKK